MTRPEADNGRSYSWGDNLESALVVKLVKLPRNHNESDWFGFEVRTVKRGWATLAPALQADHLVVKRDELSRFGFLAITKEAAHLLQSKCDIIRQHFCCKLVAGCCCLLQIGTGRARPP